MKKEVMMLGYACCVGGANVGTEKTPFIIEKKFKELDSLIFLPKPLLEKKLAIAEISTRLAKAVYENLKQEKCICVVGGDHTSAIGTFSGVHEAYQLQGEVGLIWIDAHMDSHTPETSLSHNIHGMPLATLMGYGDSALTTILSKNRKIKPENVCLIGVRSFETGEAELLKKLGVKIYFMNEIKDRDFSQIFLEAVNYVNKNTIGYGISLDIDSIDPKEAPGVDVREPEGLSYQSLFSALKSIAKDKRLIISEIVEFNPDCDEDEKTEQIVSSFIEVLTGKKSTT